MKNVFFPSNKSTHNKTSDFRTVRHTSECEYSGECGQGAMLCSTVTVFIGIFVYLLYLFIGSLAVCIYDRRSLFNELIESAMRENECLYVKE